MPYHFKTCNGKANIHRKGVVLSSQRAAHRQAISLSAAVIEFDLAQLPLGGDWRMDVIDDRGRLRLQTHFTVLEVQRPADLIEKKAVTS